MAQRSPDSELPARGRSLRVTEAGGEHYHGAREDDPPSPSVFLIGWEDVLTAPTAVERRGQRWYKREDYCAPLGYGDINGSKLRQLLHLVTRELDRRPVQGLLTAASVLSPQISMTATVARHLGLHCHVVVGGTKPESARRHPNVVIALHRGAELIHVPVGYNPALQAATDRIGAHPSYAGWLRIDYGITTPPGAPAEEVKEFHAVGAAQVRNLPRSAGTVIVTAGTCMTAASVLYGVRRYQLPVERVVLIGLGPSKVEAMWRRLAAIESVTGIDLTPPRPRQPPGLVRWRLDGLAVDYLDLHGAGGYRYHDRQPWREDGIVFHPTYEGKAMAWLSRCGARHGLDYDDTLVWVTGSEPRLRY
jgi:hypothetical protein